MNHLRNVILGHFPLAVSTKYPYETIQHKFAPGRPILKDTSPDRDQNALQRDAVRIIAFDFDGTITTRDTFALFLRYWAGTPRWLFNLVKLSPVFLAYVLKLIDRNRVKAHVVRTFFRGAEQEALRQRAEQFADEVIPDLIRPKALETLKARLQSDDTVFIVSASIDDYLVPWAKKHGIRHILATNLEKKNGCLTGDISGVNCWGSGKIDKITSKMADKPFTIKEAYGDSRGDREMLDAAEASFYRPFRL